MEYSGIGQSLRTRSDTESSDEENQLSQLLTEPSSDSNESVVFETLAESHSTHYTNGELIEVENVEDLNQQSPVEHDATLSKSSLHENFSLYVEVLFHFIAILYRW